MAPDRCVFEVWLQPDGVSLAFEDAPLGLMLRMIGRVRGRRRGGNSYFVAVRRSVRLRDMVLGRPEAFTYGPWPEHEADARAAVLCDAIGGGAWRPNNAIDFVL
jgi:hypothetical protein